MMTEFFREVSGNLPLAIENASWDGVLLQLLGVNWNFNLNGVWRLITEDVVLVGSDDEDAETMLAECEGQLIIDVFPASTSPIIDPTFRLLNGTSIQIFSSSGRDTWTMYVAESDTTFVAVPSDPEHSQ